MTKTIALFVVDLICNDIINWDQQSKRRQYPNVHAEPVPLYIVDKREKCENADGKENNRRKKV
jgi:hypothetical protein